MPTMTLAFDEMLAQVARRAIPAVNAPLMEPILDPRQGCEEGLLIESPLERVVLAGRDLPTLSPADVSQVRRMMIRARARRGLLCVPVWTAIPNPVMLLATLSRIEIIRLGAVTPGLTG